MAALPEKRRLLVACDAGNRNRRAKKLRVRMYRNAAARDNLRENGSGYLQNIEQLIVPLQRMNIKHHRACRIARVRQVHAGEFVHQPGINCAEGKFASLRPLACPRHIVEKPAQLGTRKIAIHNKAGLLLK